jgi:hypothetical protein
MSLPGSQQSGILESKRRHCHAIDEFIGWYCSIALTLTSGILAQTRTGLPFSAGDMWAQGIRWFATSNA